MKKIQNAKKLLTFKIPNILKIKKSYIQKYIFLRYMMENISKLNISIKKKGNIKP